MITSTSLVLSGCGLLKPPLDTVQNHSIQAQAEIPQNGDSADVHTTTPNCIPHSTASLKGKEESPPKTTEWSNGILGTLVGLTGLTKTSPEQTSTLLNTLITETEATPSASSGEFLDYWTKNLKLAWLWMQPGPYQDELRASQLLDKIKNAGISAPSSPLEPKLVNIQQLAQLLSIQLQEHMRQHKEDVKKLEQVQQKLDGLRTLEKTLAERDRRLGVKP